MFMKYNKKKYIDNLNDNFSTFDGIHFIFCQYLSATKQTFLRATQCLQLNLLVRTASAMLKKTENLGR